MEKKNRYTLELKEFDNHFRALKGKRIVLYGIGSSTAVLLSAELGYHFVGLLDRDEAAIGKTLYGHLVISMQEAEKIADIIIINTTESYWDTIYERIQDTTTLPVYFKNGQKAEKKEFSFSNLSYWNDSLSTLEEMCERYDVISFDFYDTLVMRKVFFPTDVFELVERALHKRGDVFGFVVERKKAAMLAGDNATLDQIYQKMQELIILPEEKIEAIKRLELEVESKVVIVRKDIWELFCRLQKTGKKIYIISDMYVSSDFIKHICQQNGLNLEKEQIWVSAEKKATKADGELWKLYRKKIGKEKALHIGDNPKSDIVMPREYDIDAYYVMNSMEMLKNSSISGIIPKICTLEDGLVVGLMTAKMCNSPFAFNASKGILNFHKPEEFGYGIYGAVILAFLMWILDMAKEKKLDTLFFMARDGYFLEKNYKYLVRKLERKEESPKAVYLLTSRRAAINASVENEMDLIETLDVCYSGTFRDFLRSRFGLEIAKGGESRAKELVQGNKEILLKLLEPYKESIWKKLSSDKENYLRYLWQYDWEGKYAVIDVWYLGTAQFYLSKLLNRRMKGFYMVADLSEDNKYTEYNKMYACFQKKEDVLGKECNLNNKKHVMMESFLTSPDGMLLGVDDKGNPVFDRKKNNQRYFGIKERINDGVLEFIDDYISMLKVYDIDVSINPYFADDWYGVLMDGNCWLSDEIKKSFWGDSSLIKDEDDMLFE